MGLASLVTSSSLIYKAMQLVGALYLVYVGLRFVWASTARVPAHQHNSTGLHARGPQSADGVGWIASPAIPDPRRHHEGKRAHRFGFWAPVRFGVLAHHSALNVAHSASLP
jgi:hypothetical protein